MLRTGGGLKLPVSETGSIISAAAGRRFGFKEGFNEEIFSSPEELNVSFS